jgi:hypothetical protein
MRGSCSSTQRVWVDWIEEVIMQQVLCRDRTIVLKWRIWGLKFWIVDRKAREGSKGSWYSG